MNLADLVQHPARQGDTDPQAPVPQPPASLSREVSADPFDTWAAGSRPPEPDDMMLPGSSPIAGAFADRFKQSTGLLQGGIKPLDLSSPDGNLDEVDLNAPVLRLRNVGDPPQSIWEDQPIIDDLFRDLDFEVDDAMYPGVENVVAAMKDALARRRFDLAPFPAAAARLLGRGSESPSDDEIIDIVKTDPALAGRVVQTANSPFYMAAIPVNSVARAVTRIGVQEARRICLSAAVDASFEADGFEEVMRDMRNHALTTAMIAEALSASVGHDRGEAFLAGLLHDAGEVAIYRLVSVGVRDKRKQGLDWEPDASLLWHLAEHYHPRVGVIFFRNWDLAASVVSAMAYHHHPHWAEEPYRRLVMLTHLSDLLAERALVHAQGPQWQANLAVRGPGATAEDHQLAARGDGIDLIPTDDIVAELPPAFNAARLPGLIRSVLLRLDLAATPDPEEAQD